MEDIILKYLNRHFNVYSFDNITFAIQRRSGQGCGILEMDRDVEAIFNVGSIEFTKIANRWWDIQVKKFRAHWSTL